MKKLFAFIVVGIGIISLLSGCKSTEIYNVSNTSTSQNFTYSYTEKQVRNAIVTALERRDWSVVSEGSGIIVAKYSRSKYSATISIFYTSVYYNINYKDSTNLDYNGMNINRHYNDWVVKLNKEIQEQLTMIANPPTGKRTIKTNA